MNDIMIFNNPEFGEIRTTKINGQPWFVAVDVCRALEIQNPTASTNPVFIPWFWEAVSPRQKPSNDGLLMR